jgi:hypothetical protein
VASKTSRMNVNADASIAALMCGGRRIWGQHRTFNTDPLCTFSTELEPHKHHLPLNLKRVWTRIRLQSEVQLMLLLLTFPYNVGSLGCRTLFKTLTSCLIQIVACSKLGERVQLFFDALGDTNLASIAIALCDALHVLISAVRHWPLKRQRQSSRRDSQRVDSTDSKSKPRSEGVRTSYEFVSC